MAPKQAREESRDAVPGPFQGQYTPLGAEKPHFRARTDSFFRSKHCLTLDTCSPLKKREEAGKTTHFLNKRQVQGRTQPPAVSDSMSDTVGLWGVL